MGGKLDLDTPIRYTALVSFYERKQHDHPN